MRHAKAAPEAAEDHSRRLTERGRRDAYAAGAMLRTLALSPDLALVSSAERAQETWQEVERGLETSARASVEQAIYSGGLEELLALISQVRTNVRTVILIGHDPTASELVLALDDGAGDAATRERPSRGLPTAGFCVLELAGFWASASPGGARLVSAWAPG
jgi:phosphohistidine phosphatase